MKSSNAFPRNIGLNIDNQRHNAFTSYIVQEFIGYVDICMAWQYLNVIGTMCPKQDHFLSQDPHQANFCRLLHQNYPNPIIKGGLFTETSSTSITIPTNARTCPISHLGKAKRTGLSPIKNTSLQGVIFFLTLPPLNLLHSLYQKKPNIYQ